MENAQTLVLDTINGLLEENMIEKALDSFKDLDKQTEAGIWQEITLQYSRYRSAQQAQNQGRIPYSEFSMYENQIKYALTELMKSVPRKIELNAKIRSVKAYDFEVPNKERFEKMIGKTSNLLGMEWFEKARKAANAVCRVVCENGATGTGFLTKEGYVFTNNHVIESAVVAKTARVEFNFAEGQSVTSYQIDPSDFKTSPKEELDFSRLKVVDRSDAPLSQWDFVEFETETFPLVGENVTIFQHPLGKPRQFDMDAVLGQVGRFLYYSTETDYGSSGSAVLNKECKVIALHHAGKTLEEGGYVINSQGQRAGANCGVLFRDIFAFIGK
jgi:V8-like Glu-specific endopeptidase